MKKTILTAILALFFVGCSQTSSVMTLDPYIAHGIKTKNPNSVSINSVQDKRENKSTIATVKDGNGNVMEYITLQNSLSAWFSDAIKQELIARGVSIDESAESKVNIEIGKLRAQIEGYSKENMSGYGEIFITIYKGNETITRQVRQTQSEFAPIRTGGALTPFVKELLNDLVAKSAEQIINSL